MKKRSYWIKGNRKAVIDDEENEEFDDGGGEF